MGFFAEVTEEEARGFEQRLSARIEKLPGGKAGAGEKSADKEASAVVRRLFAPGDTVTLQIINDEYEVERREFTARPVKFMVLMPVIRELVKSATAKGDLSEAGAALSIFEAAQDGGPLGDAVADAVDVIFGQEKGRRLLYDLEAESFLEALEVATSIVPLGRLRASFSRMMATASAIT